MTDHVEAAPKLENNSLTQSPRALKEHGNNTTLAEVRNLNKTTPIDDGFIVTLDPFYRDGDGDREILSKGHPKETADILDFYQLPDGKSFVMEKPGDNGEPPGMIMMDKDGHFIPMTGGGSGGGGDRGDGLADNEKPKKTMSAGFADNSEVTFTEGKKTFQYRAPDGKTTEISLKNNPIK